jgi:hypothetical protein
MLAILAIKDKFDEVIAVARAMAGTFEGIICIQTACVCKRIGGLDDAEKAQVKRAVLANVDPKFAGRQLAMTWDETFNGDGLERTREVAEKFSAARKLQPTHTIKLGADDAE